jgi:uncharacterized protein
MPDGSDTFSVRTIDRIARVDAAAWDRLAGGINPFVSYAFLAALEESGSVGRTAGWLPQHVLLEDGAGVLVGAAPAYLKGHSYGEYVFDHAWADAYERAGGAYYPKLQAAVPFTPVPGPRLLVGPGPRRAERLAALGAGLAAVAREFKLSSVHVTFLPEDEARALEAAGYVLRQGQQFHWFNRGYADFDAFLAALAARKRKAVKRERAAVAASGVVVRPVTGAELGALDWDRFFRFYTDTYDRKWGAPYLTRDFFARLAGPLADMTVMMWATEAGAPVAGALNLLGRDALYGRNWGAARDVPFLHFEACYYQAIDFAIARGLARVEAGTQGPHKVQRGYEPVATWSAHWIADAGFRRAVADFCRREALAVARERAALACHLPYRRPGGRDEA